MPRPTAAPVLALTAYVLWTTVSVHGAFAQTPVPQPFPGAPTPPASSAPRPDDPAAPRPPQTSAPAANQPAQPPPATPKPAVAQVPQPAGVPIYPTAEYIGTFGAGAGQEFLLYGSNLPYAEMVAFYRTALKTGGNEVFRAPMPPTHQFTIGRYNEERMVYPPSVVIKDYTWNNSPGYLFVSGTTEKRFKTIIQVVAPGPTP